MLELNTLAFISMPMGAEWLVIAALGLLIFGKRLPEVGKGIGQAIVQFKKGLKSVEDDIEQVDAEPPAKRLTDATAASTTPAPAADHKFDPYTGKPIERPKFDPYTGKPIDEPTSA
jgi:sec-independent protein translocase protein TatA